MPIEICGLSVFMGKECHTPPPHPRSTPGDESRKLIGWSMGEDVLGGCSLVRKQVLVSHKLGTHGD